MRKAQIKPDIDIDDLLEQMSKIYLSQNFTLAELIDSTEARNLSIIEQYHPPTLAVDNLKILTRNVLQPIRTRLGLPIHVNSGYRCEILNKIIGGSKTSQHKTGEAADIRMTDITDNKRLFDLIIASKVPFDQLIWEYGRSYPTWIHISFETSGRPQRGQILEAYMKRDGQKAYRTK